MIEGLVKNSENEASIKKRAKIPININILLFIFLLLSFSLFIYVIYCIKSNSISHKDKIVKSFILKSKLNSNRPPVIGITGMRLNNEDGLYTVDETQIHYIGAIEKSGGVPVSLPVLQTFNSEVIRRQVEAIDGLIIQGGLDVNPELYYEDPAELLETVNKQTDNYLMEVIRKSLIKKIPILGICRGMQILNVYFGGSLYQDLSYNNGMDSNAHRQDENNSCDSKHEIIIEKNTYLQKMFPKKETLKVNSYHHQAVNRLGDKIIVDAKAPDGIIESIHLDDENQWVFGVQFHPEQLLRCSNDFLPIFSEFISQAKNYNK